MEWKLFNDMFTVNAWNVTLVPSFMRTGYRRICFTFKGIRVTGGFVSQNFIHKRMMNEQYFLCC